MNKEIKMYDYILEEKEVLLNLIDSRKEITKDFTSYMKDEDVEEIIISGSGTSYHAALAARYFMENLLDIRVSAEYPMIFIDSKDFYNKKSLFIGISQGGQSQSTIDVLKKAKDSGIYTVSISENKNARVFEYSDINILMEIGPELSVAKTKGYVGEIMILFLMAIEAALVKNKINEEEYKNYIDRLINVVNNYDIIIPKATDWVNSIREELVEARRIIVLGYKENYANVLEGALKLLETLRYGVYGYDIEEFFHGIYNSVDKDSYIIYFAQSGEYIEKVVKLKEVLKDITDHQFIITRGIDGYEHSEKDCVLPFIDDTDFSVLEYILPTQIISALIPYDLGINPFMASDPEFHNKIKSKVQ